jgi:Do/DeqQ family serine protease
MNIIKQIKRNLHVFLLLLMPTLCLAHLPSNIENASVPSLAPMLSQATPAVVNIAVEKVIQPAVNPLQPDADNAMQPTKVVGVGSGVIINADKGYIITNGHVVSDQQIMIVTLKDGRRYRAKLIGKDDGFDIAVIQINAKHLTAITFGDSDKLKVGDFVVAIGSPFGLTQTVTSGVISALNRSEPHIDSYQNFIQTDAPINPGNSGGALLDLRGQLIGVNTAIVTPSAGNIGIGFAIPSNMVKSVSEQLIQYGKVQRGMLGVMAQNITPELADAMHLKNSEGTIVTDIVPNSPAAKAGLQVQDIIVSVNGALIHSSEQLHNMLGLVRPGTSIAIKVLRAHQEKVLQAVVANQNAIFAQQELPFLNGLRLQKFNDLEPDGSLLNGVIVISVDDTSNGAIAGLQPGDVIISANGQATTSVSKLITIAQSKPAQMLLKVARGNGQVFLVIQ